MIDSRFSLLLSVAVLGNQRDHQSRLSLQLEPAGNIELSDATVISGQRNGCLLDDARRHTTDQFVIVLRHGFATG